MHRSGPGIVAVVRDAGGTPEVERLATSCGRRSRSCLRARRTIDLQRGELERSATVDPMTGVSSRGAILERHADRGCQARRYRHPLAIVLLDVDRFGAINEAYGIAGGDAVLREVALRMRLRVREADALGRSGSDGFLATLPHTDGAGAATFADALRIRVGLRPDSRRRLGAEGDGEHRRRDDAPGRGPRRRRPAGARPGGTGQRAERGRQPNRARPASRPGPSRGSARPGRSPTTSRSRTRSAPSRGVVRRRPV